MASIQKHFDPWNPQLLERTEAQLDAILEAYSEDHPKELKFERRRTREARDRPMETLKGWADVLIGDAKTELLRQVAFKLPSRFRQRSVKMPALPGATATPLAKARPKAEPSTKIPRQAPRRK